MDERTDAVADDQEHVPPTEQEMADAAAIIYDPVYWQFQHDGTLPPQMARRLGHITGPGADTYEVCVPNPLRLDRPAGTIAVTVRPDQFRGEPALVVTTVAIVEGHDLPPGQWWTSFGISLLERGWAYDADDTDTSGWRVECTPGPDPSAPVTVAITNPAGADLFRGPALVPPLWLVMARHDPAGIHVFAGQVSSTLMPQRLDDEKVEAMLDTGDLVVARIPITVHAPVPAA
jgi:hypothetical protein